MYLISFIIQTALAHVSFFGVIASSVDKLLDVNLYLELKKNLHSAYFICILSSVFVICRDIVILFPRWSLVTSSIVLANKMKKAYVALVTPENYFLRISHGFHTFLAMPSYSLQLANFFSIMKLSMGRWKGPDTYPLTQGILRIFCQLLNQLFIFINAQTHSEKSWHSYLRHSNRQSPLFFILYSFWFYSYI